MKKESRNSDLQDYLNVYEWFKNRIINDSGIKRPPTENELQTMADFQQKLDGMDIKAIKPIDLVKLK